MRRIHFLTISLLLLTFSRAGAEEFQPSSTLPVWSFESDQAGARLGASVNPAGDVNGDGFDDILAGAIFFDAGERDEGRAYLFLGTAFGLSPNPAWIADGNQEEAFGGFVGGAGDVNGDGFADVLVAAPRFDNGEENEGRVTLYLGSPSGLSAAPVWSAEGNQENAFFGRHSLTAGDVNGDGFDDVIIGARTFDNGEVDEGRAFLFLGSSAGLETTPAWTAEGDLFDAQFGIRVGTAGDVNGDGFDDVIVGANRFDNDQINEGKAFLYLGSASGLSTFPDWIGEGNQTGANFGRWVSTAGDVNGDGFDDVLVGAYQFDNGEVDEGIAYLYLGGATGLSTSPVWSIEGNQPNAFLGWPVASAGDVNADGFDDVLIGIRHYDGFFSDQGRVLLFTGTPSGLSIDPLFVLDGDRSQGLFNLTADGAGDVNGDGFDDFLLGGGHYNNGEVEEGGIFLYLGGAVQIQATCEVNPSTLNLQSHGTSLSVDVTLMDRSSDAVLSPSLLAPVYLSRIISGFLGNLFLPVPRAEPGCNDFLEDGIWESFDNREIDETGAVTLRFTLPSDGLCETKDGNRQDIVALLQDVPHGESANLCFVGTHPEDTNPFECCGSVKVNNRGNR